MTSIEDRRPALPTSSTGAYTVARRGHVVELQLTRPALLNRIDMALHQELQEAFEKLADDGTIRAMVFSSTGKVFSAGGDFDYILAQNASAERAATIRQGLAFLSAFLDIPSPIVVALNGDAIGLGASLVLSADAVVAHRRARLADPHVTVGLAAGDGGCLVWPISAGAMRAKRHLLTGDPITAEEAHALGLVTDLVADPDDVLPAARALADRIAALPPLAVQGTKRALNHVLRQRYAEVMELSSAIEYETLISEDLRQAVTAIRDGKTPSYEGR